MIRSFLFVFFFCLNSNSAENVFRFHVFNEPSSLKSWEQKNSNAGYFLSQISSTLMSYQDGQLKGNLAQSCVYKNSTELRCKLRPTIKWSNSRRIDSSDFVRAFQNFVASENHAFRADLLFPIKNAKKVYSGKLPKEQLRVSAIQSKDYDEVVFELEFPDREFIYTLTSPLLAPMPAEGIPGIEKIRANPELWISSGAYKIEKWDIQKRITLVSNENFWLKNAARPRLEIYFVPEDSVAVGLYEKKQLDFLRRLPTLYIPKFRGRPDLFQVDQLRFDYVALNMKDEPARKALAQSLNYTDFQKLYFAKAPPGCPGLSASLYDGDLCLKTNIEAAKKIWLEKGSKISKFEFHYSQQGGDDIQRGMEWVQSEWKKNLGLTTDLRGIENKIYIQNLETKAPDIFRKGIAPERPTCLSALENFESTSSENYMKYKSSRFDEILKQMRNTDKVTEKKKLCTEGLKLLLDPAWIIPTGPIHFTLLVRPEWRGWKLNELNQLDLSELKREWPTF